METEFKIPSDLPTDPVDEGDVLDSPIPAVQDASKQEPNANADDQNARAKNEDDADTPE